MRLLVVCALVTARLLGKQAPQVTYSYSPPLPDNADALEVATEAANAATLASSEAYTAAAQQASAEAAASSAQSALKSYKERVVAEQKVAEAKRAAEQAYRLAGSAEDAAQEARTLAEAIPDQVQAAAAKAAQEVITSAIDELKSQSGETIEQIKAINKAREEGAVTAASTAGGEYRAAEMRQKKLARDDVVQARDFAEAVIPMKAESFKIMNQGVKYQAEGKVVPAQQMAIKAHDLMDKAVQMQKHAESLNAHANGLQGNMGLYDLAAKAAEDYSAYVANPVGAPPEIPDLPKELQF